MVSLVANRVDGGGDGDGDGDADGDGNDCVDWP